MTTTWPRDSWLRFRLLALAALAVSALTACTSDPAATPPAPTPSADIRVEMVETETLTTVLRPVDAAGNVQAGWTAGTSWDMAEPLKCSTSAPGTVDGGVLFCAPSLYCWPQRPANTLCLESPWGRELINVGGFTTVSEPNAEEPADTAVPLDAPVALLLVTGARCTLITADSERPVSPAAPEKIGTYRCTGPDTTVWISQDPALRPDGMDAAGIYHLSPSWAVDVGVDRPELTAAVREAFFYGVAEG